MLPWHIFHMGFHRLISVNLGVLDMKRFENISQSGFLYRSVNLTVHTWNQTDPWSKNSPWHRVRGLISINLGILDIRHKGLITTLEIRVSQSGFQGLSGFL